MARSFLAAAGCPAVCGNALPLAAAAQPVFQEGAGDPGRRPPEGGAGPTAAAAAAGKGRPPLPHHPGAGNGRGGDP